MDDQFWVEKYYEVPQWPSAPLVLRTETLVIGTQEYAEQSCTIGTQEYDFPR